jgi:hypothetical protein
MPAIIKMCNAFSTSIYIHLKIACIPFLWDQNISNYPYLLVFIIIEFLFLFNIHGLCMCMMRFMRWLYNLRHNIDCLDLIKRVLRDLTSETYDCSLIW